MTIYERVRAIQGAAVNNNRKAVNNAIIQRSFAQHFADTVDYHDDTLVDGIPQRLIVARNKNVPTEKKIYAAPGDELTVGSLVDCFDCKWLITEVDPNHEQYFSGKMKQCNREMSWQDEKTLKIVSQWITMDKPYFSNLDENAHDTVSTRMFKVYLPYDEYSARLYVDKRVMLEIINDKPITYRITSVDVSTQRHVYKDGIDGFICLYIEQDQYNPKTDRKDLMICDYIDVNDHQSGDKTVLSQIEFKGKPEIKMGGSAKKFTASFVDDVGSVLKIEPKWNVLCLDEFKDCVTYSVKDGVLSVKAAKESILEGVTVRVELTDQNGDYGSYIECKVVTLV